MILGWFDTTEVIQFASDISTRYSRLRKSSALRNYDASKRAKKVEKLIQEVNEFSRDKGLNFYKKAKLVKEIGNVLRALDIPEPEIGAFVDSLLVTGLPRV